MAPPKTPEEHDANRPAIIAKVLFIKDKALDHATVPLSELLRQTYQAELAKWNTTLDQMYFEISRLKPADLDDYTHDYAATWSRIAEATNLLAGLQIATPGNSGSSSGSGSGSGASSTNHSQAMRLPKLELPSFSGDMLEWTTFVDMFEAAVDKNTTLTPIQKFSYLKAKLKGEAARVVKDFALTDANYDIAWKALKERYHNPRQIIMTMLDQHFKVPASNGSAASIRELIDTTKRVMRALDLLGHSIKDDIVLAMILVSKLDAETKRLWQRNLTTRDFPKLTTILEFLEEHANTEQANEGACKKKTTVGLHTSRPQDKSNSKKPSRPCAAECNNKQPHPLERCQKFMALDLDQKKDLLKKARLCFRCFFYGHGTKQCRKNVKCDNCDRPGHHTLLHDDNYTPRPHNHNNRRDNAAGAGVEEEEVIALHTSSSNVDCIESCLLTTAIFSVQDHLGTWHNVRALMDNGSSMNFITKRLCKILALPASETNIRVTGLGTNSVASATKVIEIKCKTSVHGMQEDFQIKALAIPKISGRIPDVQMDPANWNHIIGLKLADPFFYKPDWVDILLGAEVFYQVIQGEKKTGFVDQPVAISSKLGWLIGGGSRASAEYARVYVSQLDDEPAEEERLDLLLKAFWEIEDLDEERELSKEEEECEKHYIQHVRRLPDGKFVVKYPMKEPQTQLGDSLGIATRRFYQVERRLHKNPTLLQEYVKFMRDYEGLNHMIEVQPPKDSNHSRNYLPHHVVVKLTSTTTKYRVVFDASAETSNGVSLNKAMMVGRINQSSLWELLIRFGTHKYAITADCEKMYRQILVDDQDQELQYVVWRENPDAPLKHYKLLTITYGTAAAPQLATRTLQYLADEEGKDFPHAKNILKDDFYMDDMMSGTNSTVQGIEVVKQVRGICERGRLPIRKFTSNSEEILQSLPIELRETKTVTIDTGDTVKALGIHWNPVTDLFEFKVQRPVDSPIVKLTKRKVSSDAAKLFDPTGLLAPVVIQAKILLQSLWKYGTDWDQEVPADVAAKWRKFEKELKEIEKIRKPRFYLSGTDLVFNGNSQLVTNLIGFADASDVAYGSCVYLYVYDKDRKYTSVSLVGAKTKVAPIKTLSTPRLELCAALQLAKLTVKTKKTLKVPIDNLVCFSDSTDTLAWINSDPGKWNKFVANRVSKIQYRVDVEHWRHVKGTENPADLASRGIPAGDLVKSDLWWNGPHWLRTFTPDVTTALVVEETSLEAKKIKNLHTIKMDIFLWEQFSSFLKIRRIAAWCLRFIRGTLNKKPAVRLKRITNRNQAVRLLTTYDLDVATTHLIRMAQREEFAIEFEILQSRGRLKKSDILSLNPFIDLLGVIRVGGRLRHSNLPYDTKHPILLRGKHPLTEMIIREEHHRHLHAGQLALHSIIQQKYWILRGKDAIKRVIKKCIVCTRLRAETMEQMMADLPSFRVNKAFPFQNVGVDYAGPFLMKPLIRSTVTFKVYLAVFVCCVTRALHFEIVSDLTTEAFLAALRRFIARRGKPSMIYSDCGTNFVGAGKELKELQRLATSQTHNVIVADTLTAEGITWQFNPPSAPHFGGLFEAGVKSCKHHLRRIMGDHRLTYEELTTVVTQIEAILNSRPITPESDDPSDLRALTPGHFLVGRPLTMFPEPDLSDIKQNRLIRWQLVQQMTQCFWKRWSNEYLTRLQQRPKWLQPKEGLKVGAMVLIKEDNMPPLKWKLARVIRTMPGRDGLVRKATVKTNEGELERPVVKLCLLPIESNSGDDQMNAEARSPPKCK